MRITIERRVFESLLTVCLTLGTTAFAAPPPGKGGGSGGGGGGGEEPPTTPVAYQLDLIPVEGRGYWGGVNDLHQAICQVDVAQVTSQPIDTQAWRSAAIVDLDSGAISYVDNLLTEPTPWTVLSDGVYDAEFVPMDINNNGDIVGYANYYLTPDRDGSQIQTEGFLLRNLDGVYEPIPYENRAAWAINDLGDVAFRTFDSTAVTGATFLPVGGVEIQVSPEAGYVWGMNVWGQILAQPSDGGGYFVWSPDGTAQYPTELKIADDINDRGVVTGQMVVVSEYKQRGKIVSRETRVPAVWTEAAGAVQLSGDDFASGPETQLVLANNQYLNEESAVAALFGNEDIWLKLPTQDGFYISNAMSSTDLDLFRTVCSSWAPFEFPTPRAADGTIDDEAYPILVGPDVTGAGIWVLRSVPSP